ncbi:MAG: NAD(P)/FAD-dependent oxidoreductase [bacterium]
MKNVALSTVDAIVVGAGPNGLAAAITLAERGHSVRVYEAADTPGGGCRTAELTLPGFHHDVCATVHALALVSPFFATVDLEALGVRMCTPEIAYAHPLDGGRAGLLFQDVERTADGLGATDGRRWSRVFGPLARHAKQLWPEVLSSLRRVPRHPVPLVRFGLPSLLPATGLAGRFDSDEARGLFTGAAAHSMRRLSVPGTAAFGMALVTSAHSVNWPVVEGGSGRLIDALVQRLTDLGGEVVCSSPVTALADLPPARTRLLDVSPRQFLRMAGGELPAAYARRLARFRYGDGAFKVDWALSGPVPWSAPGVERAGTVHVGGTMEEIAAAEGSVENGKHPERPYVLTVQSSVMDRTRAPDGQHTLWAYCHIPNGSTRDMTEVMENQIERFAPGFRDLILARHTRNPMEYEAYDANYVGGDINAGLASLYQSALGPVPQWSRYRTAMPDTYLCSSSTAPGGGVHGMSGMLAAQEALRHSLA